MKPQDELEACGGALLAASTELCRLLRGVEARVRPNRPSLVPLAEYLKSELALLSEPLCTTKAQARPSYEPAALATNGTKAARRTLATPAEGNTKVRCCVGMSTINGVCSRVCLEETVSTHVLAFGPT